MVFCDLLERFSEVTLNHLVIVFVKIQRSTNLFNVKELKESHQKPIIFITKNSPNFPPALIAQLASFRSPCIPGFNRLQVKGRPRLKSMPKGLASWGQMTRLQWRANKKMGTFEDFSKKKNWNIPQTRNLHKFVKVFLFLVEALGMPPGVFWGMLEFSWSYLAFILILCRDDCIDMQLEKSCMQTSLASKHGNSLHLWWYSVYAHINICGCISMLLQLLWMTNEKVMLYI